MDHLQKFQNVCDLWDKIMFFEVWLWCSKIEFQLETEEGMVCNQSVKLFESEQQKKESEIQQ